MPRSVHSAAVDGLEALLTALQCDLHDAGLEHIALMELTISQARAIVDLAQVGEPLPINELAHRLGLSVSATGRNVDTLVHLGFVTRETDSHDRRVILVQLTPHGHEQLRELIALNRRRARAFFEQLPTGDVERLVSALQPIVARLPRPATQHPTRRAEVRA